MRNVIILSAEVAGLTEQENLMRTAELASILEYVPHKTARGCYKGDKESSFIVKVCANFPLDRATDIAAQFGQESILFIDSGSTASLFYTDGSARYDILGQVIQVNEETATKQEAYTETQGKYYIVK